MYIYKIIEIRSIIGDFSCSLELVKRISELKDLQKYLECSRDVKEIEEFQKRWIKKV